jgi:PadR family transcriptional regulator AphA
VITGGASFRYVVLGLLEQRPMSGYDIKCLLERLSWLIGSSSFGNIYPTLHALLEDGLVTVDVVPHQDRPPRKVYTISQEGGRALQEWLAQPVPPSVSLKAFIMRLILAQDLAQEGLIAHLLQRRAQVAAHRDVLQGFSVSQGFSESQEFSDESVQARVGWRLALDYGLAVADTELAWLDRVLCQSGERFHQETGESAHGVDTGTPAYAELLGGPTG